MNIIDLSGEWLCVSPMDFSINKNVRLPGSSCENGIGTPVKYYDEYCKEAVRAPREKFEYIGPLDYFKAVELPEEADFSDVTLFFERVNIASKVWFDNIEVGRGVIGLSTPHVYRLSDRVDSTGKPLIPSLSGRHMLRIRVDNSNLLNLGDMASGYSVDTGGYWNGIIGRMELRVEPKDRIENVKVFAHGDTVRIETVTISDRHVPMEIKEAELIFEITTPCGTVIPGGTQKIELFSKRQNNHYTFKLPKDEVFLWDEFNRNIYTLKVTLKSEDLVSEFETNFGIRDLSVSDKEFKINGRTLSLRGTINCAQYPLTGYPPMDVETWAKHFSKLKEFGLNHVRFHAWCPPEAAFIAADRLGIYLGVEMPLWLNRDVTPMEFGDDEWHRLYFRDEALRISEAYGNHPSFVFFSNGNENLGDYALLETITREMKAHDDRRLYTMTSNFDHPLSPAEDYLCAFEILHNKARIQFLHDEVAKSTTVNYDSMREAVPVPFTSFEVGQYCITPDVDICERYTGAMAPVNFDIIRKEMKKHGIYGRLQDYIKASGAFAARLYKEDIEAVLRTPGMGGFQLLSLTDYTGQSTATVGILDVMFEEKGVISSDEWCGFCSETVPLLWAKREFTKCEHLTGFVSLYDVSLYIRDTYEYRIDIYGKKKEGTPLYSTVVTGGAGKNPIDIPLDFVKGNELLKVYITVTNEAGEHTNYWRIFVYSDTESDVRIPEDIVIHNRADYERALSKGGKFLLLPEFYGEENTVKSSFIPVFWSPVHFPTEDPLGFIVDEDSDVLKGFPTEKYADYQWKSLVENSRSVRLKNVPGDPKVLFEFVPNFADNEPKSPIFSFTEGGAEFLYCGFDLNTTDYSTVALKRAVLRYLHAYSN